MAYITQGKKISDSFTLFPFLLPFPSFLPFFVISFFSLPPILPQKSSILFYKIPPQKLKKEISEHRKRNEELEKTCSEREENTKNIKQSAKETITKLNDRVKELQAGEQLLTEMEIYFSYFLFILSL